jgi:hypothetical protein
MKKYELSSTLTELNRIFNLFNAKYFEAKLETPVIVVQSARKRRTLGTCSVNRIWMERETEKNAKHEISISAEYLNRSIEEVCATLLHEMVHLHNGLNDIKDTSNNYVYHNKRFKKEAEARGLIIEKAQTIGWSVTTLKPETKEVIKGFKIDEKVFEFYRKGAVPIVNIKPSDLTKEEKLERLYKRMDKLKQKIDQVEAEG